MNIQNEKKLSRKSHKEPNQLNNKFQGKLVNVKRNLVTKKQEQKLIMKKNRYWFSYLMWIHKKDKRGFQKYVGEIKQVFRFKSQLVKRIRVGNVKQVSLRLKNKRVVFVNLFRTLLFFDRDQLEFLKDNNFDLLQIAIRPQVR